MGAAIKEAEMGAHRYEHNPWRAWAKMPEWRLEWTDDLPPDMFGLTLFDEKRVLLANGMSEAERRCTAEHERHHALRGPAPFGRALAEELLVDRIAARMLMPSVRKIGHALAFNHAAIEAAAEELWVDEDLLHVRLSALLAWERAWLEEQLATVLI